MTNTISSKPNYAIPFANLEFVEGSKKHYQNGYVQEGPINRLGGDYYAACSYYKNGEISEHFAGENKYGERLVKKWRKDGDTITLVKERPVTYIVNNETGLLRRLTVEEKDKLLKEGIKLDKYVYSSEKANELLCKGNEFLVQAKESINMIKKAGEKWKVLDYRFGYNDLIYNEDKLLLQHFSELTEKANIIDRRAYRAIGDLVENLAKKFRRV